MAEKTENTTVQERSKKKVSFKKNASGKFEAVTTRPPGSEVSASVPTGMLLAAKRALLLAQNKLAARNAAGIKADVQPLTLEDVAMTVEDPGLQDAMQFSERLRTGESRILSPEESKAAWEESDRQMADLQRLVAQKFGGPKP